MRLNCTQIVPYSKNAVQKAAHSNRRSKRHFGSDIAYSSVRNIAPSFDVGKKERARVCERERYNNSHTCNSTTQLYYTNGAISECSRLDCVANSASCVSRAAPPAARPPTPTAPSSSSPSWRVARPPTAAICYNKMLGQFIHIKTDVFNYTELHTFFILYCTHIYIIWPQGRNKGHAQRRDKRRKGGHLTSFPFKTVKKIFQS